jgi:putative nucleotidyltransferase with HDIG domain
MITPTEAHRQGVRDSLPEVALIADAQLRDRVVEAWALALAQSEFARIEEIPASGNPDSPPLARGTQADHIRGVTRLALAIADALEAQVGSLGIDRDLLIAAALCHDVGKPFEFSHRNQARWRADPSAVGHPSMRHTLFGVYITLTIGTHHQKARWGYCPRSATSPGRRSRTSP